MSQLRVKSIVKGAQGTDKYSGTSIDCFAARDLGLLKHSAWLWNLRVGDTVQVPYPEVAGVMEACKGLCELELEHPKYCNHHVGTDVYAFEILEWKNERTIVVRRMKELGFTGPYDGNYESYESDESQPPIVLRERKNGGFNEAGAGNHCPYILADKPYAYRDPSY